jgi:allophanate hydrolase subunit 2
MYKKWIKKARNTEGWEVKPVKSGTMILPPEGDPIILHNHHSKDKTKRITEIRLRTQLRRAGLKI